MAEKKAARATRRRGEKGRKRTLVLSDGLYARLDIVAQKRGISRSELAERILHAGLPAVVITIDGQPFGQPVAAA